MFDYKPLSRKHVVGMYLHSSSQALPSSDATENHLSYLHNRFFFRDWPLTTQVCELPLPVHAPKEPLIHLHAQSKSISFMPDSLLSWIMTLSLPGFIVSFMPFALLGNGHKMLHIRLPVSERNDYLRSSLENKPLSLPPLASSQCFLLIDWSFAWLCSQPYPYKTAPIPPGGPPPFPPLVHISNNVVKEHGSDD